MRGAGPDTAARQSGSTRPSTRSLLTAVLPSDLKSPHTAIPAFRYPDSIRSASSSPTTAPAIGSTLSRRSATSHLPPPEANQRPQSQHRLGQRGAPRQACRGGPGFGRVPPEGGQGGRRDDPVARATSPLPRSGGGALLLLRRCRPGPRGADLRRRGRGQAFTFKLSRQRRMSAASRKWK
jgi:hypothetical protein